MRCAPDLCSGIGRACFRVVVLSLRKRVRVITVMLVLSLLIAPLPGSSGRPRAMGTARTRSTVSQELLPLQFYRSLRTTFAAIGSWMAERLRAQPAKTASTYEPVTAYLSPAPPFIDAPTNLTVTAASDSSLNLSWTAPAGGADHYEVERSQSIAGPFLFRASTAGTTFQDTSVTTDQAYLYRVRAVTSGGVLSVPSNMALGTATSFEFNGAAVVGNVVKKQHIYDIRTAINAVRLVAGLAAATWTRSDLTNLLIVANDVQELRTRLGEALTVLSISAAAYTDPTLTAGVTLIKGVHIDELQVRSTRGSSSSSGPMNSDTSTARLDPFNQTGGGGENPLSRNFNWSLPLVTLPGRAGLNLGLSLSYNSLVWTKNGNFISFDDDVGFPSPGFRLGFPVIQPLYYNQQVGKNAYLLIGPDGSRTELRQIGASALFESADSAHLLLDTTLTLPAPDGGKFVLRTTDGTKLWYEWKGNDYQCTQIKDRNGNFITINYVNGRISTVIDTLNRQINFEYVDGRLDKITQIWKQGTANQRTHTWASFAYNDLTFNTAFTNLTVSGPSNGSSPKMLSKVTLADNSATPANNSRFEFSYTSWGQIWKVSNFAADNRLVNYRSYNLPGWNNPQSPEPHTDCPRFTERRDWAENWNRLGTPATGYMLPTGVEQEVVTTFTPPQPGTANEPGQSSQTATVVQITNADQTFEKIYFLGTSGTDSGWRTGLPFLVESYDVGGSIPQRQVVTTWTQDDETSLFVVNPRVSETNVYDPSGNRKRTEILYQPHVLGNGMTSQLPEDIREYDATAGIVLRTTRTIYEDNAAYVGRRIIGLPKERLLYEGTVSTANLRSKLEFFYDESAIEGAADPAAIQHDNTNFGLSFVAGRGNLTSVRRYDVDDPTQFTTTTTNKYNRVGLPVSSKDALLHEVTVSYTDSFASNGNATDANPQDATRPFTTHAYPTTVIDAGGYSTKFRYNYDFGARTWQQTPQPNVTTNTPGPIQTFTYDVIGRPERTTSLVNNAFTRYVYGPNYIESFSSINTLTETANEGHTLQVFDGHGRVIAEATKHPVSGAANRFSAALVLYDVMGRVHRNSNPTETDITIAAGAPLIPYQFVPQGDDTITNGVGWKYVEQTYDWKSRPLITTNQDGTTKTATYEGCGCAGGEVVMLTDEGTGVAPNIKKRQQRIYSDVLGRTWKTEVLNWDGTGPNGTAPGNTVYSTTVTTFNVRDQVTQIRQYQGTTSSSTFQDTTMTYDGYGRLKTQHRPEQEVDPNNSA